LHFPFLLDITYVPPGQFESIFPTINSNTQEKGEESSTDAEKHEFPDIKDEMVLPK